MFHVKHGVSKAQETGKRRALLNGCGRRVLLVNPWIYDFAAYDLWAKPLGLLEVGGHLRGCGYEVFLIDCVDVYSPWMGIEEKPRPPRRRFQCGKFVKREIEKPLSLKSIPRRYSRYGISEGAFVEGLNAIGRPDIVLVTSGMTYWYPGAFRAIEVMRAVFGDVPVVLGGVYATVCQEHAREKSGADYVFAGENGERVVSLVDEILGVDSGRSEERGYPVFDLYPHVDVVSLATSRGCPYRCDYCASSFLHRDFSQRSVHAVVEEITYWVEQFHVMDVAFYDDALLINPSHHLIPILEEIVDRRLACRFHLPNGVHARGLTREIAGLMYRAGLKTVSLGFETVDPVKQVEMGGKVTDTDAQSAIQVLKEAGYSRREIGVYLMAGLPGQRWEEVAEGVERVWEWGGLPKIAEYSPIPRTGLWRHAVEYSPYDLEKEPLFHNNSIFPCAWEGFTRENLMSLKTDLRKRLSS